MGKRAIREGVSDSLRERDMTGKPRQSRTSRAYARHFEDYAETSTVAPDGRVKIYRTYIGDDYCQDLKLWQRVLLRILYILLTVFSSVLYFSNGTADLNCNCMWYVTGFQVATVACLIWTGYSLLEYTCSIGRLTIGEYKSILWKMRRAPYFAAAGMVCTMLASGCCFLAVPEGRPESCLKFLSSYLLAGLMLAAIPMTEKRIQYQVTPSEGKQRIPKREDTET